MKRDENTHIEELSRDILLKNTEIEDVKFSINPDENTDPNILNLDMSVKLKQPLETVTITFDKPEGMTDEQFKLFIENLQKEIETYINEEIDENY